VPYGVFTKTIKKCENLAGVFPCGGKNTDSLRRQSPPKATLGAPGGVGGFAQNLPWGVPSKKNLREKLQSWAKKRKCGATKKVSQPDRKK